MPHTQLNLEEAAAYLHLTSRQVEQLVRGGALSARYVKDSPVFSKRELHDWLSRKILGEPTASADRFHDNLSEVDKPSTTEAKLFLSQYVTLKTLSPEIRAKTKGSVLRELVRLAAQSNLLTDETEFLQLVEEREKLCSTGLVNGVAIPHSRVHADYLILDSFLVIAHVPGGIPFGSQDGKLTDLFLMPCAHNDRIHLHMLARLALLMHKTDLGAALRACDTAADMKEAVQNIESQFVDVHTKRSGH